MEATVSESWPACPAPARTALEADDVVRLWPRLHGGDAEPLPDDPALLQAWVLYHQGRFEAAARAGLALGTPGLSLSHKATCMQAIYVEPSEPRRLAMLLDVAERARRQQELAPQQPAGWYWQGHALGRYSQGVSVAKALARGLGGRVRSSLERTVALAPAHADAHLALANFHAEVIDKVGELIGGMTHGARKSLGRLHYSQALALQPESPVTLHECAQGLVMLDGAAAEAEARRLRERAATLPPVDAMERLYLEAVQAVLDG